MATTSVNSVVLTLGYENTDYQRKYSFDGVPTEQLEDVKSNVLSYNQSLTESDKTIFISDDYDASDPQAVIGRLKGIVAAQYSTVVTQNIPLN